MNWKTTTAAVILMALATARGYSQHSQVMYYMNIPQNRMLNPAFRPPSAVYIGLPVISGVKVNAGNNFVNFTDIFMKDDLTDSIKTILHPDYNIDEFLGKVKKANYFEADASVQTLGIGFTVGRYGYAMIDINERLEGNLVIPGDLFTLIFKGNDSFAGSTIDLSSLNASMIYYRETGLGYSAPVSNRLTLGFKGKALLGIAALKTDNNGLGIAIGEDYSHTFNADFALNLSGPFVVETDTAGHISNIEFDDAKLETTKQQIDFLSGTGNLGFGLDIGASYMLSDKVSLSLSAIDLGFINWKTDVTNLTSANEFVFDGLDLTEVLDGSVTIEEAGEELLDSLSNAFNPLVTENPFTTWLPAGVVAGVSYRLNKSISLGFLSYTKFIDSRVRESLTLSSNFNVGTWFSAGLSYTYSSMTYDNLGIGIAARAGIFQIYALADRFPLTWTKVKVDGSTVPLPAGWSTANIRVGLNLLFGNKMRKREDKPMIEIL